MAVCKATERNCTTQLTVLPNGNSDANYFHESQ
jgi:hypothetical protein